MSPSNLVKDFSGRPGTSADEIIKPLANGFVCVGAGGNVQKSLVGLGILHNCRGLSFYSEDDRPLAPPELLHEIAGSPAKCRQRLNVFGDVKHRTTPV